MTVWSNILETTHNFNFKDSKMLVYIHNTTTKKASENSWI